MAINFVCMLTLGSVFYLFLEQLWSSLRVHGKYPPRWLPPMMLGMITVALVLPVVFPMRVNPFMHGQASIYGELSAVVDTLERAPDILTSDAR